MTTEVKEPSYFPACKNALIPFYKGIQGGNFLVKNIPGKLYKAGILQDDSPESFAIGVCLNYAEIRQNLIEDGTPQDKAGDKALEVLQDEIDRALEKVLANIEPSKDKEPMVEPTQHYDTVAAEYELTVFPRPDGALLHKASGLALAPTIQIRSNSPDAMFYLPQLVEMLMENLTELVNTGHYSINYDALSKDFRRNMESQGLPPKQVNDLDNFFGDHPSKAQQGNATPKGNNQAQTTRPAQTQQTSPTGEPIRKSEITAVKLTTDSKGKERYVFFRTDNEGKDHNLGSGDSRINIVEPVLAALGFSAEVIGSLEIGDTKRAKNKGVMMEYTYDPQPNGQKWIKVLGYYRADGSKI